MKNKIILGAVLVLAIVGAYFFPKQLSKVSVGAVGDTNSTQRIASCVLDMSTTTPTTATTTGTGCLYNGDSKDRVITSVEYYLSGLGAMIGSTGGVATTTWLLGTSTDVYNVPAVGSRLLNTTIATSTANGAVSGTLFVASTTPGASATFPNRVWPSGTYLNLQQNATTGANSIIGTIKIDYFINN